MNSVYVNQARESVVNGYKVSLSLHFVFSILISKTVYVPSLSTAPTLELCQPKVPSDSQYEVLRLQSSCKPRRCFSTCVPQVRGYRARSTSTWRLKHRARKWKCRILPQSHSHLRPWQHRIRKPGMICFYGSHRHRSIVLTVHRALWASHLAMLSRLATDLQTSGSRASEAPMARLSLATLSPAALLQRPLPKVYVS